MTMAAERTLGVRGEVRFRRVGGEGVVVLLEAREIIVLNGVGTLVLELLAGGASIRTATERLCRQFDVDLQQVDTDVAHFVTELLEANVLEERSPVPQETEDGL
ncbi:MAG: PqqD family protein [Acidobacteriota bacterium]